VKSIFRWPGGKTRGPVQKWILDHRPPDVREYREPFVGGGGVFFALGPKDVGHRWVNDAHEGVVAVYRALAERPEEFIALCRSVPAARPDDPLTDPGPEGGKPVNARLKAEFDRLALNPDCDQALRFFFVNRTVFGGRVNYDRPSRLYFSKPEGWDVAHAEGRLERAAERVRGTRITCGDYEPLFAEPGEGVWIYADPPYVVNAGMTGNSKLYQHNFTEGDHERLARVVKACKHRVCLSYDDHPLVRKLYPESGGFRVVEGGWAYCGRTGAERARGKELLILNYQPPQRTFSFPARTEHPVRMVEIACIRVPEGRRALRGLDELAGSVRALGLLNPITLTESLGLVAGLHRLEVCKGLGWTHIPAIVLPLGEVEAQLAEIDENLVRNELTALERCEHLARRKELYEGLHPEAARPKGGRRPANGEMISPFSSEAAAKAGVTPRTVQQEVQIARALPDDVRGALRGTAVEDTKTELMRLARLPPERQREVAARIAAGESRGVKAALNLATADIIRAEPPPLPDGPFRVLVVDPPWAYQKRAGGPSQRGACPYPCRSAGEIAALPVASLAHEDATLWLWTTNAHLPDAFGVLRAWGFEHKTVLTWVKDRMGTGDWLRGQTEHCIMAVRGRPTVTLTNQTTVLHAPVREHSRKPTEFYQLVESLCPGSRLELFARERRSGWVAHGHETGRLVPRPAVPEGVAS
jgi:N6-adenosine-specific RNA methylase IME4/site-specific DNA-adenine methylase